MIFVHKSFFVRVCIENASFIFIMQHSIFLFAFTYIYLYTPPKDAKIACIYINRQPYSAAPTNKKSPIFFIGLSGYI